MFTAKGIYENGEIKLLKPIPFKKKGKVIVTIIDEVDKSAEEEKAPINLFDDLVGITSFREDGSINHDTYIYHKANL